MCSFPPVSRSLNTDYVYTSIKEIGKYIGSFFHGSMGLPSKGTQFVDLAFFAIDRIQGRHIGDAVVKE